MNQGQLIQRRLSRQNSVASQINSADGSPTTIRRIPMHLKLDSIQVRKVPQQEGADMLQSTFQPSPTPKSNFYNCSSLMPKIDKQMNQKPMIRMKGNSHYNHYTQNDQGQDMFKSLPSSPKNNTKINILRLNNIRKKSYYSRPNENLSQPDKIKDEDCDEGDFDIWNGEEKLPVGKNKCPLISLLELIKYRSETYDQKAISSHDVVKMVHGLLKRHKKAAADINSLHKLNWIDFRDWSVKTDQKNVQKG